MRAQEFHEEFGEQANYWGDDPDFPVMDWQYDVAEDATRLGYWDWVLCQREDRVLRISEDEWEE